jgi:tetratricopeptide (TPR) repeat protein
MGRPGNKTTIALVVLLLAGGYGGYRIGLLLWAGHHYRGSMKALAQRDFNKADVHLNKCLEVWPRDLSLRLLAARTARRAGDFAAAWRHLDLCKKQQGPVDACRREIQLLRIQQGNLQQADQLLEDCINNPDDPDGYLILEVVIEQKVNRLAGAHRAGTTVIEGPTGDERIKTEAALALWRQLRSGDADRVQGLIWLGRIHALTNPQAACSNFAMALELEPNHFQARLNMAEALAQHDSREAAKHLDILRARAPHNIAVCVLLASLRRGLGETTAAEQILDEVLSIHPDHVQALLERGKAALDAGHPKEAEPFLRRALDLSPDAPVVHLALSRCLHLTGKREEAKRHLQRYNEIETERTHAQEFRAAQDRDAWLKRVNQALSRKRGQ